MGPHTGNMNTAETVKLLFLHPLEFMRSKEKESSYWPPVRMTLFLMIVLIGVSLLLGWISLGNALPELPGGPWFFLALGFVLILMLAGWIGVLFISAGISHIFVVLFRGGGNYLSTFKASAYAGVIALLYSLGSQLIRGVFQLAYGHEAIQQFGPAAALNSIMGMIMIVSFFHAMHTQVQGFRAYHGFSTGKAWIVSLMPLASALAITLAVFLIILAGLLIAAA